MRKYLYLVTEHPNEDRVGNIIVTDSPKMTSAEKNKEGVCQKRDLETNETWQFHEVGLGYHDFEDEADYEERIGDVLDEEVSV
ncbi:hypothetical protein [Halobiforma nitratireducens]|uniref:Uncharacterized protein n=1 Tax=Halobiforma nitratireducens JCM 10879 TaxID=1227454 RepID=M0LDP0_9EURY|nr:hypothetical protein [Halobiforma nitratireducens]EMA31706.1 hypothetical protein C446_15343 [Halobiforma nitratireducens JCM 10879]